MTNFKRFLTLFLISSLAISVWGTVASDTIVFATGSGDGTAASTSTACSTIVSAGSTYLDGDLVTATKVYYAGGSGLKLGASSNSGNLKMNLSTAGQVKADSIKVRCILYNSSKAATIKVNGGTAQSVGLSFSYKKFDINADITYIQLESSKYIWVDSLIVFYTIDDCTNPSTLLSISSASSAFVGTPLSLTTTGGNGSTVTWSIVSGGSYATLSGSTLTPTAAGTVRVQASQGTSGGKCGKTVTQDITVSAGSGGGSGDYVLVESAGDIEEGEYLIVYDNTYALNTHYGNTNTNTYGTYTDISSYYDNKTIASNSTTDGLAFTVAATSNGYSFYKASEGTYLGTTSTSSTGAQLRWDDSFTANQNEWTLGVNSIVSVKTNTLAIRWNNGSPRFAIYGTTGQEAVQLFKKASGPIKVTASLSEFTYVVGNGPSAYQSFKVQGTGLGSNLVITAPENYRVSLDHSDWRYALTLNIDGDGNVAETTIYVRLIAGLAKGDYDAVLSVADESNTKTVNLEGSVTLSCTTPSISFASATVNKHFGDADFQILPTTTGNDLGAAVTWSSNKTSCATVSSNGTVHIVKATGEGAYARITATIAAKENDEHTACQNEVSAYYDLYITNTVTWLVNGTPYTEGTPTIEVTEGATITTAPEEPNGSSMCGGKVFVGWTTSAVPIEQSSAPDPLYSSTSVKSVNIEGNVTFYAVFAESSGSGAPVEILHEEFDNTSSSDDPSEITSSTFANFSGSFSKAYKSQYGGIKLGSSSYSGYITSKSLDLSSAFTVTLDVSAYGSDGGNLEVTIYDNTDSEVDSKTILNANFGTNKSLSFDAATTGSSIEIRTSTKRAYIDNVVVTTGGAATYNNYSTSCGPSIKADEVERLTSTKNQTVKSQAITVRGSSLNDGTLVANISGAGAAHFSCALTENTISSGAIETTYIISYCPTVFGDVQHTATLTFTDGATTSDPITLRGRSLPEHFAIVVSDGVNNYALDGSMSGTSSAVRPIPITITGGVVDYCPTRGIYSLTDLDSPDKHVHLTSATGRLYGEGSGTGLNIHSFTSNSGTGWLLTTSDFVNYHVTNATTTTRGIMYCTSYDAIGHYITSNYDKANYYGNIQFLPYNDVCTSLNAPQNVQVVAKATKATISWDAVDDATGYEVTCVNTSTSATEGLISVDAANRTASITGLTNLTNYNFTVKALASGQDCSMSHAGHFKTTNCDDVPYGIRITPAINSATIKWSMDIASTATIQIFVDEECTSQIGEDHTGLTSPATITSLAENTRYYAKILAGGTCESTPIEFQTNSPSVEIAEWFNDSIRIIINAGADASVIIEDKKESGSSTQNYADSIFFSKYFEADSENKLLALFNGTQDTIKLSNYCLKRSQRNNSELTFELGSLGRVKPGYIVPNEEIIIIRYANSSDKSAEECASTQEGYENWYVYTSGSEATFLNFSGPMSIGLYSKTAKKFIDVIGATTNAAGTGKLCQIDASNTQTCASATKSFNDMAGFYTLSGDNQQTKEVETNYGLSTNRCLLIRKNTVVSGIDAVTANVYSTQQACNSDIAESFITLSSEWAGLQVGPGTSSGETHSNTCIGMGYVGGFDYSGYYVTYDSIGGINELTGNQNEDGTYTIEIPQLDTLSCTMMRVKVYESGVEKASREYKIPIMVDKTKAWTTNDTIFKNKWHDLDACEECDVVILKGATLTKTNEGANDASTVRNLTIYPGGTMVVPNSRTFNVSSIQFRVEGEQTPIAKLNGTLNTNDQLVLVSRRIKNDRYYFFSLPYDCNISDVRWSNGEPAVNNVDYRIAEYDSEKRALEGSTKGTPGHYKIFSGSTLKAGVGYVIATNDRYLKELIFPMEIGGTNLTEAEDNKTSNKVTLHQYTGPSSINNHNWNFIAHPYVSPFNAYNDGKIKAGWLNCVSPQTDTEDAVWEYVDDAHVYLTMPSFGAAKTTFTQTLASTVGTINPFLGVFVQAVVDNEDLTFEQSNRVLSAPARFMASKAENEDESIFVGVTLSGNGQSDQTNLRIRPDFTDEYQLGYDLLKFTTYYTERPQIFMKTPAHQLAFQAVNDSVAKNTFLPMGVYCEYAGTYTFALTEDYPIDEVEAVYLYDKTTGTTTNLLYDTYSITTSGRLNTTTRFSLNVRLNRKAPQITTGIETLDAPDNMVRKILINGHVYIQRGSTIFDITGKEVFNF